MQNNKRFTAVWDPLIRIGHWTLVIAFFTAYFTEEDLLDAHVWAGYTVGIVISFRLLWGFIGSHYARFSQFMYSPATIFGYLKNLLAGKAQHYIGHNPAGGAMVLALLISLGATTVSGLKLYAIEENEGPLAQVIQPSNKSFAIPALISSAQADDDDLEENKEGKEEKAGEKMWEEIHEFFANFTLFLVALHVAGVILSSIVDKEKLVKAMFSGKKEIDDSYR